MGDLPINPFLSNQSVCAQLGKRATRQILAHESKSIAPILLSGDKSELQIEVVELVEDPATPWLREICEYVTEALSPRFERLQLVISESFRQAFRDMPVHEIGVTGLMKSHGPPLAENEYEHPPWKGGFDPKGNQFRVIMKPKRIRDLNDTYESVTEGMAHEISEGIVYRDKEGEWGTFQRDQINVLQTCYHDPDHMLLGLTACIRDKLADKYAAEHGFGREMFCLISLWCLAKYAEGLQVEGITKPSHYPLVALRALALDKSVSLHGAGLVDLANAWIGIWQDYERRGSKFHRRFFTYYRSLRREFLSMPMTTTCLLDLVNSRLIESI